MSYILDALKKSDQERKRGDVPGLQTVHIPMATEQSTPKLLYAVLALLFLLLAFVVGMMVSERRQVMNEHPAISESESQPVAPLPSSTRVAEPVRPAENKPVVTAKAAEKAISVTQKTPVKAQPVKAKRQEKPVAVADVSVQDLIEIPYLHELPDYHQQSIPEMRFAGHVYSSSPSNRSIIINNSAMSEGDSIMAGLNVEQITSNGVVFSYQGVLFKMDILQDWSFE